MARPTDFSFLRRPTIRTRGYRRYRQGPGLERPVARAVAAAVLGLGAVAFGLVQAFSAAGPSREALQLGQLNPLQLIQDQQPHFLATPVAAIPAEPDATPPPSPTDQVPDGTAVDQVKVVDPGGAGVLLRSAPSDGKLVASLRNGEVLQVLERQTVDDVAWLRVRTSSGAEGWVFGGLVLPAS